MLLHRITRCIFLNIIVGKTPSRRLEHSFCLVNVSYRVTHSPKDFAFSVTRWLTRPRIVSVKLPCRRCIYSRAKAHSRTLCCSRCYIKFRDCPVENPHYAYIHSLSGRVFGYLLRKVRLVSAHGSLFNRGEYKVQLSHHRFQVVSPFHSRTRPYMKTALLCSHRYRPGCNGGIGK